MGMRLLIAAICFAAWAAAPAPKASRPKWLNAKPHLETRAAAEDAARAELLSLLQGKPEGADAQGRLNGARVAEVYEAGGGTVYVLLEAQAAGR